MSQRFRPRLRSGIVVVATLSLLAAACTPSAFQNRAAESEREGEEESLQVIASRGPRQLPILVVREKIGESGEAERFGGPAAAAYEDRAIPRANIRFKQVKKAIAAAASIPSARSGGLSAPLTAGWQELGPVTPTVPAIATYTDRATQNSGRVTSMAIAPTCVPGNCKIWVGAAGGGVWFAPDALAAEPAWQPLDAGITSNSIGSLAVDPINPNKVYAGTGEPNGSGDSEAGVGLFTSTDGGPWTLVPASVPIARDRSIGSIAIDPTDPNHYYLGTAVARHGSSSSNGGRRTPPNAPTLGVYETTDGGASFDSDLHPRLRTRRPRRRATTGSRAASTGS